MEEMSESIEPRHAEFEFEHGEGRGTSAPWNDESDTDSNATDSYEQVKGNGWPLPTSKNEESATDSDGDDEEPSVASSASKKEERDMDSSTGSSCGDVEIEREENHNSSGNLRSDDLDTQTITAEEEQKDEGRDEGANTQETESSPEAFAAEPTLPIDEVAEGSTEGASETSDDSHKQSLGGDSEAPIVTPADINMQETQNHPEALAVEHPEQSLPIDEGARGSREVVSETADDSDTQVLADKADAPASISEDRSEGDQSVESQRLKAPPNQENKPFSSQTDAAREIAPEMVDLDRHSHHHAPVETEDDYVKKGFTCDGDREEEDEEQLREHWMRTLQTSTSTGEIVEEIVKVLKHHQKTHDLLCPVCGSCVTRRVILRKRKRSNLISVDKWYRDPLDEAEVQEQGSSLESREAVEEQATEEYQDTEAFGCLACFSLFFEKGRQLLNRLQGDAGSETYNCLPFFFPPYPWGMTQMKPRSPDMDERDPSVEVIEESEELSTTFVGSDFSCGIGSTLLPEYPWGTMPLSSKGESIPDIVEQQPPQINEPTCTCGLAQALLPDYSWGFLSKAEEGAPQSPPSTAPEAVSQHEISEEAPRPYREQRDCTCGLGSALLPDYPWGIFRTDEGAYTQISPQAQTVEETEGKRVEDKRSSCDVVAAVLPSYPWGMTTESPEVPEDEPTLVENRTSRLECLQNVGSAILPLYPWGVCSQDQIVHEVDTQDQTSIEEVKSYIEQETTIEARITSKTDVYTVTSSKTTYPGEKPPQHIKALTPQQSSKTIKHVRLDQKVTIVDALMTVDEVPAIKGSSLVSLPSTGYALLDVMDEGSEKGRLESKSSTGFAHLEEISEEAEPTGKDVQEKRPETPSKVSKVTFSPTKHEQKSPESEIEEAPIPGYSQSEAKSENISESISEETFHKPGKTKPHVMSHFPSFQWSVGKLDEGDITTPLLNASVNPEAETVISVLKPTPGVAKPKSEPWYSIFKVSKPSDEEGLTAPLLSATGQIEETEEVKLPAVQPQTASVIEAVIDVPPAELGGTTVGTATSTAAAVPALKKEADGWDILKAIVYGGLDISVASLGVTSSAAGGNAITRTVVYMGLATLLSGLIGFYHNVLNLYHHHRDHYTAVVGISLMLHGTVALVSYVIFGLLSPLLYAFTYREADNRDDKFILCCGVTIVAVTALALGKAKVSNKRYFRTVGAYLLGGVLAAIVGYLTGEHVADLLEEWGF